MMPFSMNAGRSKVNGLASPIVPRAWLWRFVCPVRPNLTDGPIRLQHLGGVADGPKEQRWTGKTSSPGRSRQVDYVVLRRGRLPAEFNRKRCHFTHVVA